MASSSGDTDSLCWSRNDLRRLSNEQLKLMKPRLQIKTAFDHFHITDPSFLDESDGRSRCPSCGQSRKYFCYTCYQTLDQFRDRTPRVQLPCRVDILKHPREIAGKSTAVHAPILAPDHATVYTHPNIPDYRTLQEKVILIFPGPRSYKLEDYFAEHSNKKRRCTCDDGGCNQDCTSTAPESSGLPFDRAVLIDCTWNQVKRIVLDERVSGLPRVEISSQQTLFWRYQTGKPSTYLATIEALYYFVLAVHKLQEHTPSRRHELHKKTGGELDDERFEKHQGLINQSKLDHDAALLQESEKRLKSPSSSNQQGADVRDHEAGQHAIDCVKHVQSNGSAIEVPSVSKGFDFTRVPENDLDAEVSNRLSDDLEGIKISENELQSMHREANVDEDSVGILNNSFANSDEFLGACVPSKMKASSDDQEIETSNKESALLVKDSLYTEACCHQYDNMLFFFKFMFYKIHNLYGSNNLRAYK